jgi:hypothetical protein
MAIDTVNKRRSAAGVQSIIRILPLPSIGITSGDRRHVWNYRMTDEVVAAVVRRSGGRARKKDLKIAQQLTDSDDDIITILFN